MKSFLKIIFHHLFLAITAVLMMKQTLLMSGANPFNFNKYLIVFLSTIIIYQLAVSGVRFPFKQSRLHHSRSWIVLMFILVVIQLMLVLKSLSSDETILLLGVLFLCFAYFTSIGKWRGLRAVPGVKAVLLALVWSLVTVVFPLFNEWNRNTHYYLLLQRFLFMLPICIVYNLRDVATDRRHGIVTIAIIAGEKKTKLIAEFCLLLFAMSVLFYQTDIYFTAALLVSTLITAFAIGRAKINGKEFYYQYIIDGCMLLQSLLVILFAM